MKTKAEILNWFKINISLITLGEDEEGNDVLMGSDKTIVDAVCSLNIKAMKETESQKPTNKEIYELVMAKRKKRLSPNDGNMGIHRMQLGELEWINLAMEVAKAMRDNLIK